jgi:SapC
MAAQLLIYETAVPVNSDRHGKCCIEGGKGYGFTRKLNSIPLMAVEFPASEPEYAIVFVGEGEAVMPSAILGARPNENLYLGENDAWQARYVPAFLRQYPFVFSGGADGKTFTLCMDETYPGINFEGRGQRLFTDDGKPSPYTGNVLKFLENFRNQFLITQNFCKKLRELGLLQPMQAEFSVASGGKMALAGFQVVDRAKLKALSGEVLSDLAKTDALELIFLHLHSMRNFNAVKDKLALVHGGKQEKLAAIAPEAGLPQAKVKPAAGLPQAKVK